MVIERLESQADKLAAENQYGEFELELNALVRKHFPHWDAKDIRLMK